MVNPEDSEPRSESSGFRTFRADVAQNLQGVPACGRHLIKSTCCEILKS